MPDNVPALFLDRDGVINHNSGYVHRVSEFVFFEKIFEICDLATKANWPIVVITNQSGIGRGFYSESDFLQLTSWMEGKFRERDIHISRVVYAPESPYIGSTFESKQTRRKPSPMMFLEVAQELHLDLSQSIMIGDSEIDMVAALRAGIPHRFLISLNGKSKAATIIGRNHDECRIWLEQIIRKERN